MVLYGSDVLDDKYDVDRNYVFLDGETRIDTIEGVVELEAGFLQTNNNTFYGRTVEGEEVEIPFCDVITVEGGI